MLIVRTYRCLDCEHDIEKFQDSADGPPKFCENCGAEFEEDAEPVPGTRAIGGSAIARSTDMTYRQLEESSAARAEELGAPALKITNLNDNLREGDVAAKAPDNVISRFDRESEARGRKGITGWGGGYATPGARVASPIAAPVPGASFVGPGHIALAAAQPEHAARLEQTLASTKYAPYVKR